MYSVEVSESPVITVSGQRHEVRYAVDGSLMNPLEGFYACLAGCAAVYAKKACKEIGQSPAGIHIQCRPIAGSGGAVSLGRFRTEVQFPEHFSPEDRARVLEAIGHCAVKEIVTSGCGVGFSVAEAA